MLLLPYEHLKLIHLIMLTHRRERSQKRKHSGSAFGTEKCWLPWLDRCTQPRVSWPINGHS